MWKTFKSFITIFCCTTISTSVYCAEFNRNSTGVIFLPYVLNSKDEFAIYSLDEIKTMLKVVSKKFCRIATIETTNTAHYKENVTYYHTYSEIHTAEAAAILNREATLTNNYRNLEVYIGVKLRSNPEEMDTEIKLAFESVRKSNQISPKTVLGIIISFSEEDISENITLTNLALSVAQKIKGDAKLLSLQVGIKMYCDIYENIINTPEKMLDSLEKIIKTILLHFDLIICLRYAEDYYPLGINRTIELVTENVVQLRDSIHSINPNMEFMVETCMSSLGTTKKHYKYQLDFWTMMDEWGTRNNISVWIHESFDNPWEVELYGPNANYGWWKLKNDQALTDIDAYEEKVDQLLVPDAISKPDSILKDKSTNVWVYIGGIVGPTVILLALSLLVIYLTRINNTRRKILTKEEIKGFINGPSRYDCKDLENGNIELQALNRPYDKSIEKRKESFKISWSNILGSGEYGVVYKAHIILPTNEKPDVVAVKMTKDECSKIAVMSILSEIKILTYLGPHKNIVGIKGAYTAEIDKGVVYVATELCELGSLKSYLRKASKLDKSQHYSSSGESISNVEFTELVQWSYEIACGMGYLAEKNVIHADLATRNVLLAADKTAKITDFGLSRRLYEYTNYVKKQQEPLPWRWMAVESLKKLEFSSQSDVWSYGVTLWEMYSMGDVPYPGLSWSLEFVNSLETGLRMKCPVLASPEIYAVISTCWEQEPQNRPTFTQLKKKIARMVKSYDDDLDGQNELCYI